MRSPILYPELYNVRVEGITSITKYSAGTTVIVKIEVQDNKTGTPLYTCIDSKTNAPTAKTLTKSNILPHHELQHLVVMKQEERMLL